MRVSVRTQDERTFHVDVSPADCAHAIKSEIQKQDPRLDVERHRLLFRGRFLADGESAESAGLGDGYTLLLVPKPVGGPEGGSRRGHRRASSTAGGHGAPRVPPEVLRFLAAQEQILGDLILGLAFGFLLGPMAGLCLIESSLSRRLRTGMLIGIILEVILCLSKMAASVPT
eukprot:evm.model.scf_7.7 EVM.evm.TU.scf_7.7   scf_7:47920-48564(-)